MATEKKAAKVKGPTASELKKIWKVTGSIHGGYAIRDYCGEGDHLEIPAMIGKNSVTEVDLADTDALSILVPEGVIEVSIWPDREHELRLTCLTLPESLEKLSLRNCKGLKTLSLPHKPLSISCCNVGCIVTKLNFNMIDGHVFEHIGEDTTVTIPREAKHISFETLSGTSNWNTILVEDGNPNFASYEGVLMSKDMQEVIRYPKKREQANFVIPEGVKKIREEAFHFCEYLTGITLPSTLENWPENAISWCRSLSCIAVSDENENYASVDGILYTKDKTELIQCPQGKNDSICVPDGVRMIRERAFQDCRKITEVVLPDGLQQIGANAFDDCGSLRKVVIPDSVTEIGKGAFQKCEKLINISLPAALEKLEEDVFNCCESLQHLVIPSGVKKIGEAAIARCKNLREVVIPNSVTTLDRCVFSGSSALEKLTIGDGVEELRDSLISGCISITELVIPQPVKKIDPQLMGDGGLRETKTVKKSNCSVCIQRQRRRAFCTE